tara:strand:+ start:133 stop:459 length:327 start_codon:yes stop_codon:yes gene_type:complete
MSGPFKMKGFTYPGKSPARFSIKQGLTGAAKGGKGRGILANFFKTSNEEDQTVSGTGSITPTTVEVDNPADDIAVENELANVSNEEKDEIIKKVVKEKSGASGEGLNV